MKTQIIGLLLLLSMIYGCATMSLLAATNVLTAGIISGAGITIGANAINDIHSKVVKS